MSTDEQVNRLIAVTARLSKLVKEENEILSNPSRPVGLKEIQEQKSILTGAYEQQIKILGDPESFQLIEVNLRRRLKEAMGTFDALLAENRVRLAAKMESTKRVFQVIADVAKEQHTGATVYGQTGSMASATRKAYRPPLSVGMNQEF